MLADLLGPIRLGPFVRVADNPLDSKMRMHAANLTIFATGGARILAGRATIHSSILTSPGRYTSEPPDHIRALRGRPEFGSTVLQMLGKHAWAGYLARGEASIPFASRPVADW
jgi:hypothetical protein